MTTIIRVKSHRARHRLYRALGVDSLPWFYSWEDGNSFCEIPASALETARAIPGITLARPRGELLKCWTL